MQGFTQITKGFPLLKGMLQPDNARASSAVTKPNLFGKASCVKESCFGLFLHLTIFLYSKIFRQSTKQNKIVKTAQFFLIALVYFNVSHPHRLKHLYRAGSTPRYSSSNIIRPSLRLLFHFLSGGIVKPWEMILHHYYQNVQLISLIICH